MARAAIITAAGKGSRFGGPEPKQWRLLGGQSVLARAVAPFLDFDRIVVVLDAVDMVRGLAEFGGGVTLVAGGENRSASVRNGLEALDGAGISSVFIQDGARPFTPPGLIADLDRALADHDGAAPGLAVTDALWRGDAGRVTGQHPREGLFRAQTPQAFRFDAILAAHRAAGAAAADDVALALAAGLDIAIVEGAESNFKITLPGDFERAERQLEHPMDIRSGTGFDVHAFGPGDHLTLCGVKIAHPRGLSGHSDADVGIHALADAIYGALAEGDIGRHFPPSDPQWKGADSRQFLAQAAGRIAARGFRLANADVTLICEAPRIAPHAGAMVAVLAEVLGCEPGRVSVKATTTERLGFAGRGEGIAAQAVVTLVAP